MAVSSFGNPPAHMALLFRRALQEFNGCFRKVVFAIFGAPGLIIGDERWMHSSLCCHLLSPSHSHSHRLLCRRPQRTQGAQPARQPAAIPGGIQDAAQSACRAADRASATAAAGVEFERSGRVAAVPPAWNRCCISACALSCRCSSRRRLVSRSRTSMQRFNQCFLGGSSSG